MENLEHEKVAVVTGSNKGIGYAIVKGLCEKFNGTVYLTARDITRGTAAVEALKKLGLNPRFHQLDITDTTSVNIFRDHIKSTHGGLDILINNAAVHIRTGSLDVQTVETLKVNYFGTLRVCEALFPLLRQNARVVTVTSAAGFLKRIPSEDLRTKFRNPYLTINDVTKLMEKFINDAKSGKAEENGWGTSSYVVSKVGVSALSIVQQKLFDKELPCRNIAINHAHPGYVDTDMTNGRGHLTIAEGAQSTLYCALQADFKGKYVWHDCEVVDWYGETTPAD